MARLPVDFAHAVLRELRPHFQPAGQGGKTSSDMFEVGWSFHTMERSNLMRVRRPLAQFTQLRNLIAEAMWRLSGRTDLGEDTLNVICRRYTRGQGLQKHKDRPQLFEEDVYGCVLHNTSDRCLSFELLDESGALCAGPHHLEENSPGTCFLQRGEARYEWLHGVETLGFGERVSITWRWIQRELAEQGRKGEPTRSTASTPASEDVTGGSGGAEQKPRQGGPAPCSTAADGDGHGLEGKPAPPSDATPAAPRPRRWGRGQ